MLGLDNNSAVLLAMDFQNDIVDAKGKFGTQAFAGHVEQRHVIETASQAVAARRGYCVQRGRDAGQRRLYARIHSLEAQGPSPFALGSEAGWATASLSRR